MATLAAARDVGSLLADGDGLEIFACEICAKTFTKRPSRNRHRLYCRKKALLGQAHRKRPCEACRQGKVKCNSAFPLCSRCANRKLACVYDRKALKAPNELISSNEVVVICDSAPITDCGLWDQDLEGIPPRVPLQNEALSNHVGNVPISFALSPDDEVADAWTLEFPELLDETAAESGLSSESTTGTNPNSDSTSPDPTLDFSTSSFELPFGNDMIIDTYSPNADLSLTSSFSLDTSFIEFSGSLFESPYLKLRYLTSLHHSISWSSFIVRRQTPFTPASRSMRSKLGQGFLLQNIRTYPNMLLESTNLPPFIHASVFQGSEPEGELLPFPKKSLESLAVCHSIVQMYSMKTEQTSPFLWRTVASERKRLEEEHLITNEWNLLAMLQAITIYILLRIFDEDSFSVDFDNDLIQTMTAIAIKCEESGFLYTSEVVGELPIWSEWILMESKRRTVTLLFIIHLLFDINPGQRTKAFSGLSQLPLPAHKSIWQATTEAEWTKNYNSWLREREGRPSLTYGDMLYLGTNGETSDLRVKDLNAWYVNVDAFGVLVMMAATSLSL